MSSEAAEAKTEAAPASGASSGGGGSKLPLILSAVNTVAVLGMVAILFISFQKDKKKPSVEDIAPNATSKSEAAKGEGGKEGEKGKEGEGKADKKKTADYGKMVTLDQFTVNLATPGSVNPKFVRVNISLEVPTDDIEGEITSKMPQVRNVIIDLFNSKRPADLATAEGRDYLKEEIKNAINGFLVSGKLRGVYFTNFALAG